MDIVTVDPGNRRSVRAFLEVPHRLYRGCPQWVAPMASEVKAALGCAAHPYYAHSEAAFFLARRGKETIGRIGVLDNAHYNAFRGARTAFFTFYDVRDDAAASDGLLDAAFDWARRRGLDTLEGPRGLLRTDPMGLLVAGFEHLARMGRPYNYPYYEPLLLNAGFAKEVDWLTGELTLREADPQRLRHLITAAKRRRGFAVRGFRSKTELREMIPIVAKVFNDGFQDVWGYYPVTEEEISYAAAPLMAVAVPELVKVAMKGDQIAGFFLAVPDVSPALQRCSGRMWPIGWLRVMRALRSTRDIGFMMAGLLPQYRGVGANALLYSEIYECVKDFGMVHGEFGQMAETNIEALNEISTLDVRWYKKHRVFRRPL